MRQKALGKTGLDVSIVGLGTAFLGMRDIHATHVPYEDLIRDIDEELGFQTVVAALEAGCTLVDTAALYGGGLVALLYGGISPEIYISRLSDAISLTHFKVGMIKAPFMGLVIGIVACAAGLRVKGSAESLGLQTTNSVVQSIFLVVVLDGLFAIFFASIGM